MKFLNNTVLNAVLVNVSTNSAAVDLNQMIRMSAQIIMGSGTATGQIQLQVSNDICTYGNLSMNFIPTNWSDLGGPVNVVAGGLNNLVASQELSYRWVRAQYIDGSGGTGTATVTVTFMFMSV